MRNEGTANTMTDEQNPSASSTRTRGEQTDMEVCCWCHELFQANGVKRAQKKRYCSAKCRAAFSREVGVVGALRSARRLKTVNTIVIHSTDDRVLQYPIGTKLRIVREPEET
jgi:hypothetical protein